MKVYLSTGNLLLTRFLTAVLEQAEGITFRTGSDPLSAPDGKGGWVLAVDSEDLAQASPELLLKPEWVSGVVVFDRVPDRPSSSTAVGPYDRHPGIVTVVLPCDVSHLVEALLSAGQSGSAAQVTSADDSSVVLVAEDSDMQRQLVVSTLKSEGFQVLEAEDGRAALDELDRHRVDVLVTDVEMPRMTGLELARAVRSGSRFASLPILMLTTLSGFEQVQAGFEAGASDYLVKPAKGERELFLEEMIARVHHLLRGVKPVEGRTALVVDDSAVTRGMVATAMTGAGFAVTTANDGAQARAVLENEAVPAPHIIVTDLEMPVMDGLRLTHYVKSNAETRDIPVIILSASTYHQHRVLGKGFGVDAFISKPFSEEKLLVTVDQVLVRNRLEKERRELSKILGRDVIKAIHGEGLEPRKRELTILFSDLAGFSKMCFGMQAGDVVTLLNDYFDMFVEYVLREQGYVNKFIGDALMALFSELPGLDPPQVRAARAAVEFQRDMKTRNATEQEPLLTRIGINTGDVIMGLIGAGERRDYTVIGDQVNRAQRLEGKAPVGGVLLSEAAFAASRKFLEELDYARIDCVKDLALKGIGEAVSAYAVTIKE